MLPARWRAAEQFCCAFNSPVSVVDLVCEVEKPAAAEDVNAVFRHKAQESLKGVLAVSDEPLVSIDFKGNSHSAIVDALSTMSEGNLVKVVAWYDNEWGYSARLVDLAVMLAKKGL